MIIKIQIFFFVTIIASFVSQGQQLLYKNYTILDGLPSNNVFSMMQDNDGFIWFSTDNGASRFDGTQFKNFTIEDGLPDNSIIGISQDSKGRIWFKTYNGKLAFYLNGRIYNEENSVLLRKVKFDSSISFFYEDSKKNIWIGSYNLELIRISPMDSVKKFRNVSPKILWEDANNNVNCIYMLGKQYLVNDTGFVSVPLNFQVKKAIFLKEDTSILLLSNMGLLEYNVKSNIVSKINNIKGYNINNTTEFHKDKSNNLWLSTLNGAVKFTGSDFKNQHFYFTDYGISYVLQDDNSNYWFSTFGYGVFFTPSLDVNLFNKENGLIENNVASVCILKDGNWLVGTQNGGLQFISKGEIKTKNKSLLSTYIGINEIANDLNGNTYIMTDVFIFKYCKGKITKVKDEGHWYKSLYVSEDGTCWVGKGRDLCKIRNDEIQYLYSFSGVNRIYAIVQISIDEAWLGTDKGLYYYKERNAYCFDSTNFLLNQRINTLTFSLDSTLWIGTNNYGLISLKNNKLTQYSVENNLLSNQCNMLLLDSNKLYVATNRGLNILELKNGEVKIRSYSSANGLLSSNINKIVKKNKFEFLLATNNGLVEFDERTLFDAVEGRPYIDDIFINDKKKIVSEIKNLKYSENSISINFSTLNFNNDGLSKYKYQLIGADDKWNYSNSGSVKYSHLRPGSYKFLVTTQSVDGSWSQELASFGFKIGEPWWETWWFRLFAIVTFAVLILFFIKWRISSYKRRVNHQRLLLKSELKALRAQINPHFIFNSLNSIQDFIMMNQKEDANLYLSKFASLMRAILSHSRATTISLAEEIESLRLYLELESLRFEGRFNFRFTVDKKLIPEELKIPSMVLQPFIENAILHGLATIKDGMIEIRFIKENNFLECSIQDNGIGRKKAGEIGKKRYPSLGMKVTEERIDLLSEYQRTKIDLQIVDLVNDRQEAAGTKVIINFPLN